MAGGTGGHIFPALSVADVLKSRGIATEWLGATRGMEEELLRSTGIPLHCIAMKGVRGKGLWRLLLAPFMAMAATIQAMRVIRAVSPGCVLGFGGYVTGPGGVAARLLGKNLLIHEQNSVAGISNRILTIMASRVMEAFPGTFTPGPKVIHTGNPVRAEIVMAGRIRKYNPEKSQPLRILVLGGSQGATAINELIPELLANWRSEPRPQVWHQTGRKHLNACLAGYRSTGVTLDQKCRVEGFIADMAQAYGWADLVVCRSGASTVSELAVAGLPSVLIPYPHHADQQQVTNARWLSDAGAAHLVLQSDLSLTGLTSILRALDFDRQKLIDMASTARTLAVDNAGELIVQQCLEVCND